MLYFGRNLLRIREKKDIPVKDLADKLGVERQTIYDYQNDKSLPDKIKLEKLAEILQIKVADLFVDTEYSVEGEKIIDKTEDPASEYANKDTEWYKNTLTAYIKQAELGIHYTKHLQEENKELKAELSRIKDKVTH